MKHSVVKSALVACMYMLMCVSVLYAQDGVADDSGRKTLSPYFVVLSDDPEVDRLPLKSTVVDADVVGAIADVKVKQVYVNTGRNTLEAIYTFPLSTKAAVYGMTMTIGSRVVRATIEEKSKARAAYEEAKDQGKRASLLEQSRPNVFTMNVTNIAVGDTIEVELRYTEVLVPEQGVYSFVYPTVVGPRYGGGADGGDPNNAYIGSPYTHAGQQPTYTFGYTLRLHSAVPLQEVNSPSHNMTISYPTLGTATISCNDADGGNRDVVVNYSLRGNSIESGVMLYEGKDENFFLMMVQPPKQVAKADIPPREYIFIVDVSGSMHGTPLDVSKALMRNLILGLDTDDHFNVLLFSGASALMDSVSVPATEDNISRAIKFIDEQRGYGGTEVLGALNMAYAVPRRTDDVSRTMVIVTDGYVGVEQQAFEIIRRNADNTNFFAFGIGQSVNRYIIEGMAFVGNGEPMIITDMEQAPAQADRFRQYISTPVLTRIKVDAKGMDIYDVEPMAVPDMMAERPIMIFGKYRGDATGSLTLSGKVGRKSYRQTFDLGKQQPDAANSALRYLWARERIKYLEYLVGQWGDEGSYQAKEIAALGLKYGLMTNYTSFIAIDEQVVERDGKPVTVKQPLPMPAGVSDMAVAGGGATRLMSVKGGANSIGRGYVEVTEHSMAVENDVLATDDILTEVQQPAQYPGGIDSMYAFIGSHLRYPPMAAGEGIEGTVYIAVVVERDGTLSNIEIKRDIGGGCGQEAVRVVNMMPRWQPARHNGRTVRSRQMLEIKFELR